MTNEQFEALTLLIARMDRIHHEPFSEGLDHRQRVADAVEECRKVVVDDND